MNGYPLTLNIQGEKAVVIGGGKVAYRKIKGLLRAGATIMMISPNIISPLEQLLINEKNMTWQKRHYEKGDLEEARIVIAATDNPITNEQIAMDCKPYQLLNVVDRPELGNFTVPAQVQRGKLLITVSTGGASPLLAQKLIKDLTEQFPPNYEAYIDFLALCREKLKSFDLEPDQRKTVLSQLLDPSYLSKSKQEKVIDDFSLFIQFCTQK